MTDQSEVALDPKPFVHRNLGEEAFRDFENCPGCVFDPRPGYSQNIADYA